MQLFSVNQNRDDFALAGYRNGRSATDAACFNTFARESFFHRYSQPIFAVVIQL